ncbi:MAG: metallophosphoesterase family protein [Candidatus Dormibacteraeota bacterium]|nr:metallophosphoesterase family protein [Candidatus Dormibacteraeota bacterium]
MKVALLSDIHANRHALEAVLEDLPAVDDVICLGDVVGYGGDPKACVDVLRMAGWVTLAGNHDRACTDPTILGWFNDQAAEALRWTIEVLDADRLQWLAELPDQAAQDAVLLVHGSPREPTYEYVLDDRVAAANLDLLGPRVCFHGHTHIPGLFWDSDGMVRFDYDVGAFQLRRPQLVNPGSVGQPRDGNPDASYLIWDTEAGSVDFRRVAYDREAAKWAILDAGLPPRFAYRLDIGS